MSALELIAVTAFGLEAVVVRELRGLGYEAKPISTGRVAFQGDELAVARANLFLRAADRVLIKVGAFRAEDFGALFDGVSLLEWERWIARTEAFPVNGRSVKSQLSSVPACQRIVKKAIVERLKRAHKADALPESGATVTVEIAMLEDIATLTIDTSGPGLHKRGYRPTVGEAALKETLAAGLVLLSNWEPRRPLIDPFCGSGTIAIEAAMIAMDIAPGALRSFDAAEWRSFPGEAWDEAEEEARDRASDAEARKPLKYAIHATDIDDRALSLARQHAKAAGVERHVHVAKRDFYDLASKAEFGCIVTNPPYGVRLGDTEQIADLYRAMPVMFRGLPTWSFHILTARLDLERILGQQATRRRKMFNSQIECGFFSFLGPKPPWMRKEESQMLAAKAAAEREKLGAGVGAGAGVGSAGETEDVGAGVIAGATDDAASRATTADVESVEAEIVVPGAEDAAGDEPDADWVQVGMVRDEERTSDKVALTRVEEEAEAAGGGDRAADGASAAGGDVGADDEVSEDAARDAGADEDDDAEGAAESEGGGIGRAKPLPLILPAFGGLRERDLAEARDFADRLAKRVRHLRKWPSRGVTCFRLYERDCPDVPLIIDRYEDHVHVTEYERGHSRSFAMQLDWYDLMQKTIAEAVGVPMEHVVMKSRPRQRGLTQHEKLGASGEFLIVREGGLKFIVNLHDYVDTGLFLDHRNTRGMVRDAAAGKRFLNLFCYTGSFTVYAAAGGAATTTSVDLSNTYLEWAARNMSENGFADAGREGSQSRHRFVKSDAIEFLAGHEAGEHYDLAVIDPPTFSNSKSTERDWEVQSRHVELLLAAARVMSPGGVIFFSTNYRRFKLDEAALSAGGVSGREISQKTVPEDFRNRRVHRCWRLMKGQ